MSKMRLHNQIKNLDDVEFTMCCHGTCSKETKNNYSNNDLGTHCHHCKTTKTKQKLDRMSITLKHYIALVSQKNIKQKQNT
jgi:hypothetical protein